MKVPIICFTLGLSEEDIEKGKAFFYGSSREAPALEVVAVTGSMLDKKKEHEYMKTRNFSK